MNKARSRYAAVVVLLLASFMLATFGNVAAQDGKVLYVSNVGQDDFPSIDPSIAEDVAGIQIIDGTFTGLTTLNEETVAVEPGMASEWAVSEDGLTYTFTLLENVPWVFFNEESGAVEEVKDDAGNTRYVTANDFVYGILRTLNPDTAGPYAYVAAPWIAGGAEYNGGEGAVEDVAVKAIDDYTLEIVAAQPAPFLINIFGMWMLRAQPQWAVEAGGDQWTEQENHQSYGPFALKEWLHDESLTLIKNPFWPGTESVPQAKLDEVVFMPMEQSAKLANYEADEIDMMDDLPITDIDRLRVEYPDELTVSPGSCTYYYGFNVEKEPFTNAHARRAFSMAIDRLAITENLLKAGQQPAGFFTLPFLVAAPHQEDYPDYAISSDAEAAQAEWQMYLDEAGITADQVPPITLMYNESELHASIAQAAQQMWTETLGVEVQLTSQEFGVFLETRKNDAPQVFRAGWCYDYPDAHNFLYDVMRSDSTQNDPNWVNTEFDALVDQAFAETDPAVRAELYAQAENLLVNVDAALAPIYFYAETQLTKPYVIRTISLTGIERFEKWDLAE